MHAFAGRVIQCLRWLPLWPSCALLSEMRRLTRQSDEVKLASQPSMPARMATRLAQQVPRPAASGLSTPRSGTGNIAPGAMVAASGRMWVARSGCNGKQPGRTREKNWIGRIDGDAHAGRVRGWRLYRGLEPTRGTGERTAQSRYRAQAHSSSARRASSSERAGTTRSGASTETGCETGHDTKESAGERAGHVWNSPPDHP